MGSPKKIKVDGLAEIEGPEIICTCGFCNGPERENPSIEFNFKEQKIFYFCNKCKKMNEIKLGKDFPPPFPKTRLV